MMYIFWSWNGNKNPGERLGLGFFMHHKKIMPLDQGLMAFLFAREISYL